MQAGGPGSRFGEQGGYILGDRLGMSAGTHRHFCLESPRRRRETADADEEQYPNQSIVTAAMSSSPSSDEYARSPSQPRQSRASRAKNSARPYPRSRTAVEARPWPLSSAARNNHGSPLTVERRTVVRLSLWLSIDTTSTSDTTRGSHVNVQNVEVATTGLFGGLARPWERSRAASGHEPHGGDVGRGKAVDNGAAVQT